MSKKEDFEIPKVINCSFSTKSAPTWYNFCNSTIPWEHIRTIWGSPVFEKKAISSLAGNLNSGCSYLITAVILVGIPATKNQILIVH